ncbi:MAG TPA: MHYT domain-containing protein [Dongiaceae bacterium]|nr:MHYT domain-containing protein [Dongiaceae bacterium]
MDHPFITYDDPRLVILSLLIALLASFTSLQLADRILANRGLYRSAWLCAAALALGGGIWSMHFIGMLALHMPLRVTYDVNLTIISLLLAISAAAASYRIVVENAAAGWRLALGGVLAGIGVAVMHYTGMAAMTMQATVTYDPVLFTFSVVIAVAAATAALWLSFNLHKTWHRLVAALVMAAAISGMHYTGMAAARMQMDDSAFPIYGGMNQSLLALVITATSTLVLGLGLFSSLLDRRSADYAVRETTIRQSSERRYRSLVRNSADIILVLDRENRISYETPAAERILGYPQERILGRSILDFFEPVRAAELSDLLMLVRGGEKIDCELPIRTADGMIKWVELIGIDLTADPSVLGIVLTLRDITERQKVAAELTAAKERAEAAAASKSAFLKNISHELRTPLNSIIGFSDLLIQQPYGPLGNSQYADFARDINRGGKKLLAIINTIIDFTKAETGQQRCDNTVLDPLAEARLCIRLEEETITSKKLQIILEPDETPASLFADRSKLRQTLLAVLSNATKFTPDGGKIAVTLEIDSDGDFSICIQDNGIGMSEADIAIALQPFSQVDNALARRFEGTGLGLPVSKALMELHGGRLTIQSGRGVGTLVTLSFPAERVRQPSRPAAAE